MSSKQISQLIPGLGLSVALAIPAWYMGARYPIIGGPVFAILLGMLLGIIRRPAASLQPGIKFASKKILQWAVVLLGFGLNLSVVLETGQESLPIILSTILTSLVVAYVVSKQLKLDPTIATLVGVGSSICGGSAVAATAPVIEARDEEVAQAISVIFFFNVVAALIFPTLGQQLSFDTTSGAGFGIFAGTAINDTSSVTAAASTWDSLFNLATETLDKAVTVKLTRTLAIIPITMGLSWWRSRQHHETVQESLQDEVSFLAKLKDAMPSFIIYFVLASIVTSVAVQFGVAESSFSSFKQLSKLFIIIAMGAIGLNTDLVKLVKSGTKALLVGAACWIAIILVSLGFQHFLGLW